MLVSGRQGAGRVQGWQTGRELWLPPPPAAGRLAQVRKKSNTAGSSPDRRYLNAI